VGTLLMMHRAMAAAEMLAAEGVNAEVIDPRSLVPFDWPLLEASVQKTTRLVVVTEGPRTGSVASEIAAGAAERLMDYLTAPIERVTSPDIPVPFAPPMEDYYRPDARRIAAAARRTMGLE
jgi:acetoin:2,6-dichlorophenolindophenol oxidoreductase subunit beta